MSVPSLSPKVASLPQVQEVLHSLDRSRARARNLAEQAKNATTPMVATLAVQAGAVAHGAIQVYGGRMAPTAVLAAGIGAVAVGLLTERPECVLAGNGILAPVVAAKTMELLSSNQGR